MVSSNNDPIPPAGSRPDAVPPAARLDPSETGARKSRIEVLRSASPAGAVGEDAAAARQTPRISRNATEPASSASFASSTGRSPSIETRDRGPRASRTRLPVVFIGAALLGLLVLALLFMVSFPQSDDEAPAGGRVAVQAAQAEPADQQYSDQQMTIAPAAEAAVPQDNAVDVPPSAERGAAPAQQTTRSRFAEAPADQARSENLSDEEPSEPDTQVAAGVLGTVRTFYNALTAGNGAAAAQLVVPGKRQSGPLSAAALTRYYSSFQRPLRVGQVTALDADTVRVRYDYVLPGGRLCEGQATVELDQRSDPPLIQSIRTQGPC